MQSAIDSVRYIELTAGWARFDMKRTVNAILDVFARFLGDKRGATAIEYTLIASLICIGILAGGGILRDSIQTSYTTLADRLTEASQP